MFRLVEADRFLSTFASDRSHMKERGQWKALPPSWPTIRTATSEMNLDRFVDVTDPFEGEVLDLPAIGARFTPR
jgi:hypothetical protein